MPHPTDLQPTSPLLSQPASAIHKPCTPDLDFHKGIFATPSPPPPGSFYWKYVTPEEDARWYNWAGKDSKFDMVQHWKRELETMQ